MAFMRIDWLPDARRDFALAQIMATIVNMFRGKGEPMKLIDAMPWAKSPDAPAPDDVQTRSKKIMGLFGWNNGGRR
ncbi:MAG: hypothetical protein HQM06_13940 [Magnetococcales bacterium]|nr:hypothetical protein [Magnetococcales bacterium]